LRRSPLAVVNTNEVPVIQDKSTQPIKNTTKFPSQKKNVETPQRKMQGKIAKKVRRSVSSGPTPGQIEVDLPRQNHLRPPLTKIISSDHKSFGPRWAAKKIPETQKFLSDNRQQTNQKSRAGRKTKERASNRNLGDSCPINRLPLDHSQGLTKVKKLKCASLVEDLPEQPLDSDLTDPCILNLNQYPTRSYFNVSPRVYEDIFSYSSAPMSFSSSFLSFSDLDSDCSFYSSRSSSPFSTLSSNFDESSELIFFDDIHDHPYLHRSIRNPVASMLEVLESEQSDNEYLLSYPTSESVQRFSDEYQKTKKQEKLTRPIPIRMVDPLLK